MGWQLLAVISAVAAGLTAIFAKVGLADVPPHLGNVVRTVIVLALSIGILWWSGEHQKASTLTARAWLVLALSGIATAVSWVAYFKALSMTAATPVNAIDKASLLVTMVLSIVFLGEHLSWRAGVGVALVVTGSVIVSAAPR